MAQTACDTDPASTDTPHSVVLGAGWSSELALASMDADTRASVRAILDDDQTRHGPGPDGLMVKDPQSYPRADVQRVIITSEMFESQLTRRVHELFPPTTEIAYTFDRHGLPALLRRCFEAVELRWHEPHGEDALWFAADGLQDSLRRHLATLSTWRYGPPRPLQELRDLRGLMPPGQDIAGRSVLDIGCGRYQPLALSLLLRLVGAQETAATDLEAIMDEGRSARAMADLTSSIIRSPTRMFPEASCDRRQLLERIERIIDLDRLETGKLFSALTSDAAMDYRVESIYQSTWPEDSFDLIVSRDVIEHLEEPEQAIATLKRLLRPGGLMIHIIDLSDHRRYQTPGRYHHWSHLIDLDEPTHLNTNRLRFSEYEAIFKRLELQPLTWRPRSMEPLPPGVKSTLASPYRDLSDEDLAVTSAVAVLS